MAADWAIEAPARNRAAPAEHFAQQNLRERYRIKKRGHLDRALKLLLESSPRLFVAVAFCQVFTGFLINGFQ